MKEDPEAGASPAAAGDPGVLRRRVVGLAWPVIGENLLETLLGIVDTLLVAGLGAAAIAGVGTGQQMTFFLLAMLAALSVGSSVLVAQAVGARALEQASQLARQSLVWSVLFGIPLAAAGVALADPMVAVFGLSGDVAQVASGYFRVTMGTVVVMVARVIAGGVLRGAGDSRTPMVATAIANGVNAALAWGLIYGHWGLPALGAVGSAWATFLARGLALALVLRALWAGRGGVSIAGRAGWRPDFSVIRRVLALGVPASLEQVLISTAFLTLTVIVAHLGTATLAAQRIQMSALSLSFMPGIGFSIAATTLVGQSIGAQRPRDAAVVSGFATRWAVIWMGAIGLAVFAFAEPIMRWFTTAPDVVRIGAAGLRTVALAQPAWAVGMVQSGSLRGTGDTRFPLLVSTAGVWSAVLLAWLGVSWFHTGLVAVWGAFLITSPVTSTLSWARFRRRVRALEAEAVEAAPAPPAGRSDS